MMKRQIVFKAKIVLGSLAAVLIVLGGHSVMAQTSATGSAMKTEEQILREIIRQEDEKFPKRTEDFIFASGLVPRPIVGRKEVKAMEQSRKQKDAVVVKNGASIQAAIDAVADEGTVGGLQRPPRQLPPPTDVDPKLTEESRRLEQQLCDAILAKDAKILDRLLGPEFTLRVADIPQSSLPRAIWMDNTLNRLKPESCEQYHHAARKLADDLAVVSLLWTQKGTTDGRDFSGDFYVVDFWKKRPGDWQIIARYSSPVGKPPDRPLRQLPSPTDSDPQLTDLLRQLEQELSEAARHGFKDTKTMERLVSPEFTQRVSDAPERSLPRSLWGQPSGTYKIESIEGRHHAARKLTENLAVVSLLLTQQATSEGRDRSGDFYVVDIWKKSGDRWQMIARYSSPMGKKFDRSLPQ